MKTTHPGAVVEPGTLSAEVKEAVQAAFRRAADSDARHVQVDVSGSHVTLHGNVESWAERDAAERAARATPGVASVTNRIEVGMTFYL